VPENEDLKVRHKEKQEASQRETPPTWSIPEEPTQVSFVLVWLAATTLSLDSASRGATVLHLDRVVDKYPDGTTAEGQL
jgi:hypothetical protein